jgi:hypothetical protein
MKSMFTAWREDVMDVTDIYWTLCDLLLLSYASYFTAVFTWKCLPFWKNNYLWERLGEINIYCTLLRFLFVSLCNICQPGEWSSALNDNYSTQHVLWPEHCVFYAYTNITACSRCVCVFWLSVLLTTVNVQISWLRNISCCTNYIQQIMFPTS